MILKKVTRWLDRMTQDSNGATALIMGMTLASSVGVIDYLEEDVDHLGQPEAYVETYERASSGLDDVSPLVRSFKVAQKQQDIYEWKYGVRQENGSMMITNETPEYLSYKNDNQKLEVKLQVEADKWLSELLTNDQISETDFEKLMARFQRQSFVSKDYDVKELAKFSYALHESQLEAAKNGVGPDEAKEIAAKMMEEAGNPSYTLYSTVGLFMVNFIGVMIYGSGPGRRVANWAENRENRRRRKPKVVRQKGDHNAS